MNYRNLSDEMQMRILTDRSAQTLPDKGFNEKDELVVQCEMIFDE